MCSKPYTIFAHSVIRNYISRPETQTPSLTKQSIAETDADSLRLSVVSQSVLAQLAADTGLLVAAEGQLVVKGVVGVDPDGAGAERARDLDGGVEVLGVHGGGEAVGGVVAELDGLLLGLELSDRADRAEDLLLHDLHVLGDVGEDGGLDEVALVALALATGLDGGTGVLAGLDVPGRDC